MLMKTIPKIPIFLKGQWSLQWKEVYIYIHIWFIHLFFSLPKNLSKWMMWNTKKFLENLALLIVKSHLPLQFMKSVLPKCLILCLCLQIQFHSQKFFCILFCLTECRKPNKHIFSFLWRVSFHHYLFGV